MIEETPPEPERVAILSRDGQCTNVILLPPGASWDPGEGLTTQALDDDSPVGPGYTWDGSTWSTPDAVPTAIEAPPALVDPALITAWQGATTNAQLRAAGAAIFSALGARPA